VTQVPRQDPRRNPDHRTSAPKRSWKEWTIRGALALGALALGYFSVASTLANVVVKVDPGAAHALAPGDGQIKAALALRNFANAPTSAPDSPLAPLALQALQNDPTAVDAVIVLGLQAQLRNQDELADELFAYSTALTRRELQPQLWAIEKAVTRGDIEGALANYDIAFRTSQRAREMLFPVLARAISEPRIRQHLLDILATNPTWGVEFIRFAAAKRSNPRTMVQFLQEGTRRDLPIRDSDRTEVVKRLVARNEMEDAWAFYKTFRPGAERNRSRDPRFELDAEVRAPFDWNLGDTVGLSAAILTSEQGGILEFSVPTATRATVVSQTMLLPPGDYILRGRSREVQQPERSQPYWSLTCAPAHALGRVEVPNSDQNQGRFAGRFTVPTSCPVQVLSLVTRSSDTVSGVFGQIEYIEVVPAENADRR
jgi:hypothetical protein